MARTEGAKDKRERKKRGLSFEGSEYNPDSGESASDYTTRVNPNSEASQIRKHEKAGRKVYYHGGVMRFKRKSPEKPS